jgi:hypothetical protein
MFCCRAGHLDEFCFRRKRIEKRCLDYVRNSYRDEVTDFLPHSYSRVPPHSYSHASSRTSSRALSRFSYGSNHRSFSFGSRENSFVPKRFSYGPHPHRGDRFPCMHGFPAREFYTHFKPRHLDNPCFSCRGSRPTGSKGEVQKTLKTPSGHMVKCWISKIYLTNLTTESLTFSRPM